MAVQPVAMSPVALGQIRFIGPRLPPEITLPRTGAQDKAIGGTDCLLVVPQTLNTAHTWHVGKFADRWRPIV